MDLIRPLRTRTVMNKMTDGEEEDEELHPEEETLLEGQTIANSEDADDEREDLYFG